MLNASDEDRLVRLMARCRHDPLGFVKIAYPWKTEAVSSSDGPRIWQADILNIIGKHLQNKETRFKPLMLAVASGHGIGKAQPKDLLLHTPDGLRKWGDIKSGDFLFDENGNCVKVKSIYEQGFIPVYKIKFDDGSETFACSDHLWNVRGRKERRNKKEGWRTLKTSELIKYGIKRSNGVSLAKQWEIPMQGPAQFPTKKVPISPYMLGVWLGDGSRNRGGITSIDSEVIDRIICTGETAKKNYHQSWGIKNLAARLKDMGILDKYSYQKSVPVLYLENDVETRSEVLRGLLDTDGEVNKGGTTIFSSTSNALAKDVVWLVRSLGGKAMMQPSIKKPYYKDGDGNKKLGRDCWRITIQMPAGFQSFYIKRKQERIKPIEHRYLARWIESISLIGDMDSMCVKVESETGLYLTNDFIVTHNTALVAMIADWALSTCADTKIVLTASTNTQLITKTFPSLISWVRCSINAHWFTTTATSVSSRDPEHVRTWRADAIPWSTESSESFAGLHNKGRRIILIFDESSAIDDAIWEVAEGALTDENTEIIWLAFGNPTRNVGRFRECFGRFKHRWITKQIDSRAVEGTNKEEIQAQIEAYGEDSDFVRVRVKGEFPRAGSMQFIPGDIVDAARSREPFANLMDPVVMGVDVARYGSDSSVIVTRRGRDATLIPWVTMKGADTMTVAARVMEEAGKHKPDAVFVDGGGVGAGVVDRLRQLKLPVVEVQFGAKSDYSVETQAGPIIYANKRAEMWGTMREWLKGASIPNDPELAAELVSVEYGYVQRDGKDAIQLEKKEDMRKRGLASPDKSDALCFVKNTRIKTPDGEKNIQDLKIGDFVETPFGKTRVVKFWESETTELTTVKFSNGSELCGKGEHRIFVWGEGKKRLDALTLTDVVSVYGQRRLLWKFLSLLSTVDRNIQFSKLVDIIRAGKNVTALAFFTGMCGLITSERFRKITIFITKMICGGITTLPILNLYINPFIAGCTHMSLLGGGCFAPPLKLPFARRQSGTHLQKESNGINSMLSSNGKMQKLKRSNVNVAEKIMKHTWGTANIAQAHVCKKSISQIILQTRETVRGVGKSLWRIVIEKRYAVRGSAVIESGERKKELNGLKEIVCGAINYFSRRLNVQTRYFVPEGVLSESVILTKVYNLTLEEHNAYYANEVLVYNCLTFCHPVMKSDHRSKIERQKSQHQIEWQYDPRR